MTIEEAKSFILWCRKNGANHVTFGDLSFVVEQEPITQEEQKKVDEEIALWSAT